MKALFVIAALGLSLMGSMGSASAQTYGGRDYGPRDRGYGFNEREYLRCNPDVRRAVRRGIVSSGAAHYRVNGRYERRRLSC